MSLTFVSKHWLVQARQFSICTAHLGKIAPPSIGKTNMARPKQMLDKKLNIEIERLKKAQRNNSIQKKVTNPVLQYTDRSKVFNDQLMREMGKVMIQFPSLVGHGIAISKINTTKDFSEARVFWISSKGDALEELSVILEAHAGEIRQILTNTAGLGAIPKISFHYDKQYLFDNLMDQLMEQADMGPKEVNDQNIEIKNIDDIVLNHNCLGLNRSTILYNLEASVKRSSAVHRQVDTAQVEHFIQAYRQGIVVTDNEKKKERDNKIKVFLRQRRKDDQKMRKETHVQDRTPKFSHITEGDAEFHDNVDTDEDVDDFDYEAYDFKNEKN